MDLENVNLQLEVNFELDPNDSNRAVINKGKADLMKAYANEKIFWR